MQYKPEGLQDKFETEIRSPFKTPSKPVLEGRSADLNYEPHYSYANTAASEQQTQMPPTSAKFGINEESLQKLEQDVFTAPNMTEHIKASQLKIEKVEEVNDPMKYEGIELFFVHKTDPNDRLKAPEPPTVEPGQEISAQQYIKRRMLLQGSWYHAQFQLEQQTHKQYWNDLLQKPSECIHEGCSGLRAEKSFAKE